MKLSIYTFVQNGIYFDFHIIEMLKHHLPLADEIIVNEGYSTDGTYEAIKDLDPKIRIFRNKWDVSDPNAYYVKFKEQARKMCTGDWCILLDADEFIPEWEFQRLRQYLSGTDKMIVPLRFTHFYGNYKVYIAKLGKFLPQSGLRIHRNMESIQVFGDGSTVRMDGANNADIIAAEFIDCHHFSMVRKAARLREKWRTQALRIPETLHINKKRPRFQWLPGFLYDLLPYRWDDKDFLEDLDIYEGHFIKAVRDNPNEFVRDNFYTYKLILRRHAALKKIEI